MRYERNPGDPFADPTPPTLARKGRGAASNRAGRFEPGERPLETDGWEETRSAEGESFTGRTYKGVAINLTPKPVPKGGDDDELPPLKTHVALDTARSIIARNTSPDIPFDQS